MTMEFPDFSRIRLILASRSPQRRELLCHLLPGVNFEVIAPISSEEEDLSPLTRWSEIRERLVGIARQKAMLVASQAAEAVDDRALLILAADTTILVPRGEAARALEEQPLLQVLGNPPESAEWPQVVRSWFENHYLGKTHWAATAVCLIREDGSLTAQVVTTAVTMRPDMQPWIEWYLATGEPIGKAGGYALQGAASVFVSQVQGSISNVIGLPLECVAQMLMNSHCSSTDE